MKSLPHILFATACVSLGADAIAAEFSDYPGESPLASKPKRPKLLTRDELRFRTVIREQSALGPNYNGHYRLVHWGCGTNCENMALVDLSNGKVAMLGQLPICSVPARSGSPGVMPDTIQSITGSRLFYAYECQMTRTESCPNSPEQDRRHSFIIQNNVITDIGVECLETRNEHGLD